jgi:broad specificity phosphatase PhoE
METMDDWPFHIFAIFTHLDCPRPRDWPGDYDDRPLTEVGRRQAEFMAGQLLAGGPVDAILSAPNLRCRQSLEPLAMSKGLPIQDAPGFQWQPSQPPPDGSRDAEGTAYYAGRAFAELRKAQLQLPSGSRIVLCAGGIIVGALFDFLAGVAGITIEVLEKPILDASGRHQDITRGGIYTATVGPARISLETRQASSGFPHRPEHSSAYAAVGVG